MQLAHKHGLTIGKRRCGVGHLVRLALVALPVLWLAQQAFFGQNGIRTLWQKQHEYARTMAHVRKLEEQNRNLNQSVHELQSNPDSIEAIAREQLHLIKPGEIVYTYPVQGSSGAHAAELPH